MERTIEDVFLSNEIMDFTRPIITVITPYYNNTNLTNTVRSVLSQDYPNIEYIIADDCSDNIEVILNEIKDILNNLKLEYFLSFKIQRQIKNVGTVKNLNSAIKQARGEIIFFLAADDMFYNNYVLSKWVSFFFFLKAIVSTAKRVVCKNTISNIQCIRPKKKQIENIKKMSPQNLYYTIAYENYISGCCTAYRKECFKQYGYFDEAYILLEDHPMVLKLLKKGVKISFWNNIAIYYMNDGISSVTKLNKKYEQDVEKLLETEAKYQGHNVADIIAKYEARRNKLLHFYNNWTKKKYMKASKIYPEQAVKEALKPARSIFMKLYMYIKKLV